MFDDGFISDNSVIHRFDPRFKIVIATVFSFVIALSSRWTALIPGLFFSVLLVSLARLPLKKVGIRLLLVNGLIFFLWLFLPFSVEGSPLFSIGALTATKEGALHAAIITVRSNTIVLALISLISTSPVFALARAMGQLGIPGKIVQLFFFTYRYLHVIDLEYNRLIKALKTRGFQPKTNLHTYKTYAYLVGMLLIKSYDRSERIQNAMLCRGFKGRFYNLSEFTVKPLDLIMMPLMLLAIITIAFL